MNNDAVTTNNSFVVFIFPSIKPLLKPLQWALQKLLRGTQHVGHRPNRKRNALKVSQRRLPLGASTFIHRAAERNCLKSLGRPYNVALGDTEMVLFGPFWPSYTGQVYGRSVAPTPFRTVSERLFSETTDTLPC